MYVDLLSSRSEFENILNQNNGNYGEILMKTLEQDLAGFKSSRAKGKESMFKGIIGCCCSSTLSSHSNFRTSWLVFESHRGQNITGKLKPVGQRNLVIKAEVNYVNAEEAKEVVAVEGYSILDVRDKKAI
ncbi:hypothetical protein ACSBR2_029996 [Camellia fascicularis]